MAPFSYARRAILWRHNVVPFNGAILWHVCTRHKQRASDLLQWSLAAYSAESQTLSRQSSIFLHRKMAAAELYHQWKQQCLSNIQVY